MIFRFSPAFSQSFIRVRSREPAKAPAIISTSVACEAAAISRTSSSFPSTGNWPSRELSGRSPVERKPRIR